MAERRPDIADRLAGHIADAEARLGARGRVLIRPSGTEPLVRVMVEAEDTGLADEVAGTLAAAVAVASRRWGSHPRRMQARLLATRAGAGRHLG